MHKKTHVYYCGLIALITILCVCALCAYVFVDVKSAGGMYYPDFDIVLVNGDASVQYMHYAAAHEIGHHIWYTQLNATHRAQFTELYDQSIAYDDFVSDYAQTNVGEDFAETYAYLYMLPFVSGSFIITQKVVFIRDYTDLK